jgi:aminopeptidase N
MNKHKIITALAIATSIFMGCTKRELPTEGVSTELAKNRKATIDSVSYQLHFAIPDIKNNPINGTASISFVAKSEVDAIIDFKAEPNMLGNMLVNGKSIEFLFVNGHIVIPKKHIEIGENSVIIEFVANNGSLNRNDEFLYTLLVPDRASTVFPCFDQPDMKATFELSLTIPANWVAVSNGIQVPFEDFDSEQKTVKFASTLPISTYLFAFATGKFETIKQSVNGFEMTLYHRENDDAKVKRNVETIFAFHAQSLKWLENYTNIPYPFGKLDIVLIPGFQYSGMEHPGAIFYRDSRLLLDENPTVNQKLRQVNLIAHEVAHQWFGNLVTMRWFNDVWLKEVFAGLMADKIVNPLYPEINHDLSFLLSHYPRAYSVDRTEGANPIVQTLDNLLNAGTLYGDIIYHKAPIMMRQMEMLIGEEAFKRGVRDYLEQYQMANANWDELVEKLKGHTNVDLVAWSDKWTLTAGRPIIHMSAIVNQNEDKIELNKEVEGIATCPPMQFNVSYLVRGNEWSKTVWSDSLPVSFTFNISDSIPIIIANSNGLGYGCFKTDSVTIGHIINSHIIPNNDLTRASFLVSLHEQFLEGLVDQNKYFEYLIKVFESEKESQIQSFILSCIEVIFRKFDNPQFSETNLSATEEMLWKAINSNAPVNQKRSALMVLTSIFQSPKMVSFLYDSWISMRVGPLSLTEDERTSLALELMIRKSELFDAIYEGEIERITNSDRKRRFSLIAKAASPLVSERIAFFNSLSNPLNRKPEPWVTDGLRVLHHPLRSQFSIRFIEKSLNMLPEIQRTGDIFFPKDWLDATLHGHSSIEALEIVEFWLANNPNLSDNLKLKVLQSVDMLKRSAH